MGLLTEGEVNRPSKSGWGLYLGAGAFLAFGLLFAGIGARKLIQFNASRDWPSVSAEVISAEIDTSSRRTSKTSHSTSYTPRIVYRYTVNGQTYTSERAAFAYKNSRSTAQDFVKRFHPGAQVSAFYDPANPSEAVLVREGSRLLWVFIAFGSVFAAIGGGLLIRLLNARRQTGA